MSVDTTTNSASSRNAPFELERGASAARKLSHRRISINAASAVVATAMSMAAGLVIMPLALTRLGVIQFGVWMIISSLLDHCGLLDAGLAPTLVKKASAEIARGDRLALQRIVGQVASMYVVVGVIAAMVLLVGGFAASGALHVPIEQLRGYRAALVIVSVQIGCAMPMSIWSSLTNALQDVHIANMISIGNTIIKTVGVAVVLSMGGELCLGSRSDGRSCGLDLGAQLRLGKAETTRV